MHELSLHAKLELDADALSVSLDLTEFFMLDPAKMQAVQKKLEDFAAERQTPAQ